MERKNLIGSARTVMGLSNRATSHRGIKLAPLLLVAVMLAAGAKGGIRMTLDRPVHAPETCGLSDGRGRRSTRRAGVRRPRRSSSNVHPPPIFGLG